MDLSNITINMHSSIRVEGGKILYFDPFKIGDNLQDADMIFITHEHFDHYDLESIGKIRKASTVIVAPESMKKKILSDIDIDETKCLFLNPGGTITYENIYIEGIPAYNKLKPFHPKHNGWLGYLVTMDERIYYIAGDTDVTDDIKQIHCDVALIPIGGMYTMDKKQAAQYIAKLTTKAVIPTHYGDVAGQPQDGIEFKQLVESTRKDVQVEIKIEAL